MKILLMRLSTAVIEPLAALIRRLWLQSTIDGYYRDIEAIRKHRANDIAAEQFLMKEIVALESEVKRLAPPNAALAS